MTVRVLTGITPSGTLHLGNYVGCIRPAIAKSKAPGTESFYFLSDYHALIKCQDPARIEASRIQIAATWLACGLDPQHVHFYRQSDLPETLELNWILNCVTSKGLMNRAHAYKAKVDANLQAGDDPDNNVTMGLYCYPILMAADIMLFNAQLIPVGKDQIQHIEMCRDIASRFNLLYGQEIFVLPEALIDEDSAILPGLDGRKMSKSYDNVIPLFEGGEKALRDCIMRVVTDSRLPGEPKDPDSTSLTQLYGAFASHEELAQFRAALEAGLSWGEAKEKVFAKINAEIAPLRARYEAYMREPEQVERILREGAERIRPMARALIDQCRHAVGLRAFAALAKPEHKAKKDKGAKPSLKQYRESDGRFWFKLKSADGKTLLTAGNLESGKACGALVKAFKDQGLAALETQDCQVDLQATPEALEEALKQLRED